jgi:cytochrome b
VEPDTIGHRAAWGWAGKATAALGAFVREDVTLAPLLRATAAKLRR